MNNLEAFFVNLFGPILSALTAFFKFLVESVRNGAENSQIDE